MFKGHWYMCFLLIVYYAFSKCYTGLLIFFSQFYKNSLYQANNNLSVRRDFLKKKQEIISIGFHTNKFENQKK